ncbi:MAG TPA: biotin carboxylase N-terminal domain-containing protein [Baekduia sp.]|uniref:acetyl/propionyl/methylcrotonyl-CoA carboxylase subunit alpha n=1 Tax=Baekduia sp. TaxID=2600305 RepID=UPI002C504C07|nr:biotin carboxylase N-terminal domain-containing protein [Baekduia sp.]HMJ36220.1 biotin carboxylase N-terminal domain-containing protein [Baekduia sp.]
MHELSPVLIANRGEIAIRIARTVHALGLATVGVVTEADVQAHAAHADACDVTVPIASYLDPAELLRAARAAGARSVHPGYGFLSENAAFARAVADAGLTWIGPPASAIELMGDKGAAKEAAAAAGVPVVPPGDDGGGAGGFPLIIKAVAGGGGKGMRVVRAPHELEEATKAAQREARAAFGDDRVLVERYLERPRHIEVQVLADRHGTCVHLGERECSLQRRHQKVVEEAPSPAVGPALRARMGEAAVALAQACGYEGAGTVEFITTGPADEFFFLEMNTRLQVEHPVTELVYGVDLVEQQLRVAAGERLSLTQDGLQPHGHAVEARLYAEDPAAGFLPATGTVRAYREPSGPGLRVDSGIRAGSEVGTSYDPMLAKVVAHGPDRATALRRLDRALATLEIVGVTTNAAFSRALLARDDVRAGEQDTGLLERVLSDLATPPPEDLVPAAVLAAAGTARPAGPWRRPLDGHREAQVGAGRVTVGERSWTAAIRSAPDGSLRITLDGVERRYAVAVSDEAVWIARDGHHLEVRTERRARAGSGAAAGSLEAPMPGTVLLVHVADGDTVAAGDVLLVLESMKMELSITAPHAGTVAGLALAPGDRVALKQPLVAVVAPADPEEAAA